MAHIVKCRWCKEKFDTDKVDEEKWVMPAKGQYYHIDCWNEKQLPGAIRPEVSGDEGDFTKWRDNICDFIKRDLKGEYNASRISKMMLEYKMKYKDWTYKGMFFALKYFYEIKNNSWSKANGAIGILPYIYYDGTEYSYTFTASGTSESLVVWSKDKYYKGTVAYAKENPTAATLTANDDVSTIDVNGLTKNLPVKLILTVKDSTVSAKAQIAIPDHFKVVMTFKNCTTEKVSFNSNINWGGVKAGKWSVDETVFDNLGKEANLVDGKLIFYVSKDYDVSGTWVAEQAPTGANFKFEATVGTGNADGGLWYKLPLDQDTVEITYYDDQIK